MKLMYLAVVGVLIAGCGDDEGSGLIEEPVGVLIAYGTVRDASGAPVAGTLPAVVNSYFPECVNVNNNKLQSREFTISGGAYRVEGYGDFGLNPRCIEILVNPPQSTGFNPTVGTGSVPFSPIGKVDSVRIDIVLQSRGSPQ